jgi:hypothetical protein
MDDIARQVTKKCAVVPLLGLSGCAAQGAPSFILFGAYFPGWMLCALVGLVAATGVRVTMVATRLSDLIPYQLFVCASAGLIIAAGVWLLWFEQ